MSRFRSQRNWVGICPHCKRKGPECDAEPCPTVAAYTKPKPVHKPQPALVCVICERPGCWTNKAGCPGPKEKTG